MEEIKKATYHSDKSVESQIKECKNIIDVILIMAQAIDALNGKLAKFER